MDPPDFRRTRFSKMEAIWSSIWNCEKRALSP
jgi:hypothetical protein